MRWMIVAMLLLCMVVLGESHGAEGKRKKMRRKVIVSPSTSTTTKSSTTASTTTTTSTTSTNESPSLDETVGIRGSDKVPRGFLDDYYAQFESRLFGDREDASHSISERQSESSQRETFGSLPEKYMDYLSQAGERQKSQRISYENGGISSSGGLTPSHSIYSPYMNHHQGSNNQDSSKTQLKGSENPLNNFFGLSGISSQSIQLGLTFTVPFLSFPLSSIGSILNGVTNSSGDLFNFDTQSLMIGAVMVAGALFILPQLIYWLTGVNLSAFTWGRNDDSGDISSLINTVDEALYRYDIDTRSCMAKTLCRRMRSEDSGFLSGLIGKFISSDIFQNIMGKEKTQDLKDNRCPVSSNCPWDIGPMTKFTMDMLQRRGGDILSMATRKILEDDTPF